MLKNDKYDNSRGKYRTVERNRESMYKMENNRENSSIFTKQ